MPVSLALQNDAIVLTITTPWKLQDLLQVYPQAKTYFDEAHQPLPTIADITQIGSIPPNALTARKGPFLTHPNSDMQIVVGVQQTARVLAEAVFKLTNYKKVKFFETMDEAWAFLNKNKG